MGKRTTLLNRFVGRLDGLFLTDTLKTFPELDKWFRWQSNSGVGPSAGSSDCGFDIEVRGSYCLLTAVRRCQLSPQPRRLTSEPVSGSSAVQRSIFMGAVLLRYGLALRAVASRSVLTHHAS